MEAHLPFNRPFGMSYVVYKSKGGEIAEFGQVAGDATSERDIVIANRQGAWTCLAEICHVRDCHHHRQVAWHGARNHPVVGVMRDDCAGYLAVKRGEHVDVKVPVFLQLKQRYPNLDL